MKKLVGRGACFGDYDNDGDIDAYIVNLNDRGAFLRNNKGNQNNWITLNLIGTTSNRDGIGARVKITSGGTRRRQPRKKAQPDTFLKMIRGCISDLLKMKLLRELR